MVRSLARWKTKCIRLHPTHVRSFYRWSSRIVCCVRWGYEQARQKSSTSWLPVVTRQAISGISDHTVLIYLTVTTLISLLLPIQIAKQNKNWGCNLSSLTSTHIRKATSFSAIGVQNPWNAFRQRKFPLLRHEAYIFPKLCRNTGYIKGTRTRNLASIMTDPLGWKPRWGPSTQPACQVKQLSALTSLQEPEREAASAGHHLDTMLG